MPKPLQPIYTEEGQQQRRARRKARGKPKGRKRETDLCYIDHIESEGVPHGKNKT